MASTHFLFSLVLHGKHAIGMANWGGGGEEAIPGAKIEARYTKVSLFSFMLLLTTKRDI